MLSSVFKQIGKIATANKLNILIYHQVMEAFDPMRPGEPDVKSFRWQMKLLRDYYKPMSLREAVNRLEQGDLPANAVCVTFDDGYLDNLKLAQPILAEFNIPATVFVATGFSNGVKMWNDRLIDLIGDTSIAQLNLDALEMPKAKLYDWDSRRALLKELLPKIKYEDYRKRQSIIDNIYRDNAEADTPAVMMTVEQVKELAQSGIEIGAHTVDHPILTSQTVEEQATQIAQSKATLENWLQQPVVGFAYPNGKPGTDYNTDSVEQVKKAGFDYAVSTNWGISTPDTDRFQLNRFTPWDQSPTKFHMRLFRNSLNV